MRLTHRLCPQVFNPGLLLTVVKELVVPLLTDLYVANK